MNLNIEAGVVLRRAICSALLVASMGDLAGCGGGGDGAATVTATGPRTIEAGQTVTLAAGETVLVPAGTIVYDPSSKSTVTLAGNHSTLEVTAGAQVTVPATATGPADDTINAH